MSIVTHLRVFNYQNWDFLYKIWPARGQFRKYFGFANLVLSWNKKWKTEVWDLTLYSPLNISLFCHYFSCRCRGITFNNGGLCYLAEVSNDMLYCLARKSNWWTWSLRYKHEIATYTLMQNITFPVPYEQKLTWVLN